MVLSHKRQEIDVGAQTILEFSSRTFSSGKLDAYTSGANIKCFSINVFSQTFSLSRVITLSTFRSQRFTRPSCWTELASPRTRQFKGFSRLIGREVLYEHGLTRPTMAMVSKIPLILISIYSVAVSAVEDSTL